MSESAWDKLFEINLKASFLLARETVKYMNDGNIIFISSIAGYFPLPPLTAYGVSKTALIGLTKALATELAPSIRVNCVAPGIIKTKFSELLWKSDEIASRTLADIPLNRFGEVKDVAGSVAFLCSEDADWITGETIVVAGGVKSRL